MRDYTYIIKIARFFGFIAGMGAMAFVFENIGYAKRFLGSELMSFAFLIVIGSFLIYAYFWLTDRCPKCLSRDYKEESREYIYSSTKEETSMQHDNTMIEVTIDHYKIMNKCDKCNRSWSEKASIRKED